ncbi:MAG: hypothetical protein PHU71_03770 [Candidatus Gracilibacteria bacterium]|nr:hypothetical protein [Candidatus Gracilibacteria bacterium]
MFITIYGINNIGKSTQVRMLVERLQKKSYPTEYLKYPIYDLEPTGPAIDRILRSGEKQAISEIELQSLYAQNRRDFEPKLKDMLAQGQLVVAEDYVGTGIAWGLAKGANLEDLEKVNAGLLKEDLVILLDGESFNKNRETQHIHEGSDELLQKCREAHLLLAKRYGWQIVNANQELGKVSDDIWNCVRDGLKPVSDNTSH